MSRRSDEYGNIEEEVVGLLTQVLAELPPGAASLELKRTAPSRAGVVVVLKPQNPAAAAVVVHAENGLDVVDFNFGPYGTTWELPIEGTDPKADKNEVLREVREMCRAVFAGKCEHQRGFLSVTGSIQFGGHRTQVTDSLVLRPKPSLRGTRKYQPYVSGN